MAGKKQQKNVQYIETSGHTPANILDFQCLDLRVQGASYAEIGDTLGIPMQTAYEHCRRGNRFLREEIAEKADEMRQIELARLDGVLMSHWANRANPRHADVIIKLIDQRARLAGLNLQQEPGGDVAGMLREFMAASAENIGVGTKAPAASGGDDAGQ